LFLKSLFIGGKIINSLESGYTDKEIEKMIEENEGEKSSD